MEEKIMRVKLLILFCLAFFATTISFAQSGIGVFKVYVKCGRIGNDGCDVPNAKVIFRPIKNWAESTEDIVAKPDEGGYFSQDLSFGEYELIISAEGYKTYQTTFYISSDVELKWGVRLHPSKSSYARLFKDCKDNFSSEDYDTAIEKCGEAIEADTTQSEAHFYRAESIRKNPLFLRLMSISDKVKRRNQAGIEDYTEFLKSNPNNIEAIKGRGILSVRVGKYDSGIEDLTKVILGETKDAEVYLNRGNAFYNTGNFQLAVLDYTKALQLDATMPKFKTEILTNRATAYKKLNKKVEWCEDSREVNPKFDCNKEWNMN
jgi:tetratricopeptide (TPR) repeat protein